MSDFTIHFDMFVRHMKEWEDYEVTLKGYQTDLLFDDLPQVSSRLPESLRTMISHLNQVQHKMRRNLGDASTQAGVIADALYDTAKTYARTEADNEAESRQMIHKLNEATK